MESDLKQASIKNVSLSEGWGLGLSLHNEGIEQWVTPHTNHLDPDLTCNTTELVYLGASCWRNRYFGVILQINFFQSLDGMVSSG